MSADGSVLIAGAAGGCGTTLLAGGVALAWAAAGGPAALIEADVENGDLAGSWGVPADRTLDDLGAVVQELGPAHVSGIAHPHATGVLLLLGPARPGAGGMWDRAAATRLAAAVAATRPWVADAGAGLGQLAAGLVPSAAAVLVVAPATVAGARRGRRLADRIGAAGGAPPRLVLSRAREEGDMGRRAVERATGLEVAGDLPHDPRAAADICAGRWPRRSRSGLLREIARVAAVVAP